MTSSPSQGLAPVTTVHEETRAASGGAALTQQDEEANERSRNGRIRDQPSRWETETGRHAVLSATQRRRKRSIPNVHRVLQDRIDSDGWQRRSIRALRIALSLLPKSKQHRRKAKMARTTTVSFTTSAKRALTRSSNGTGSGPRISLRK